MDVLEWANQDKYKHAIDLLRENEPPEGYYLAFSGGKDSQTIYHLAKEAGVKFDAHYQLDLAPPEVKQFIRQNYPDVIWERQPGFNFYEAIVINGFPGRRSRWCCRLMKEMGGRGNVVVLGVRWEESVARKRHTYTEIWAGKQCVNPILNWTSGEVFSFLISRRINTCSLYQDGFKRLGCVLCPMLTPKEKRLQIQRWPQIALSWQRAFARLYSDRKANDIPSVERWHSGKEMFDWYVNEPGKIPTEQSEMSL